MPSEWAKDQELRASISVLTCPRWLHEPKAVLIHVNTLHKSTGKRNRSRDQTLLYHEIRKSQSPKSWSQKRKRFQDLVTTRRQRSNRRSMASTVTQRARWASLARPCLKRRGFLALLTTSHEARACHRFWKKRQRDFCIMRLLTIQGPQIKSRNRKSQALALTKWKSHWRGVHQWGGWNHISYRKQKTLTISVSRISYVNK